MYAPPVDDRHSPRRSWSGLFVASLTAALIPTALLFARYPLAGVAVVGTAVAVALASRIALDASRDRPPRDRRLRPSSLDPSGVSVDGHADATTVGDGVPEPSPRGPD